jgi:hypothetical protein
VGLQVQGLWREREGAWLAGLCENRGWTVVNERIGAIGMATLATQFYPSEAVCALIGFGAELREHDQGQPRYPSLSKTFRDMRAGRRPYVSVATADKLLTATGHHLWELGDPL